MQKATYAQAKRLFDVHKETLGRLSKNLKRLESSPMDLSDASKVAEHRKAKIAVEKQTLYVKSLEDWLKQEYADKYLNGKVCD